MAAHRGGAMIPQSLFDLGISGTKMSGTLTQLLNESEVIEQEVVKTQ